jgi:hypothetical protein
MIIVYLRFLGAPVVMASWIAYQKLYKKKSWAEIKPDLYIAAFFCFVTGILYFWLR